MARTWKCGKCGTRWPRTRQLCTCGRRRPKPRKVAHKLILETPYEVWAKRFGDRCNICGREASPVRKLDRDHDHVTGKARGLLCFRCNRALPAWVTAEWLDAAAEYLRRDITL